NERAARTGPTRRAATQLARTHDVCETTRRIRAGRIRNEEAIRESHGTGNRQRHSMFRGWNRLGRRHTHRRAADSGSTG
ncbi:hypothetical protein ATCCBAA256_00930, partial [Mycobacterium montefiorense]